MKSSEIEEIEELGYGNETDGFLIHGDNLRILETLRSSYSGKVRCIFIDPPYNTKSSFKHYSDKLDRDRWLSMMRSRLEIMRELLHETGSIWITIDDRECHYLKVMMDEIFGDENFVANIVWQKRTSRENRKAIGSSHDHILVYAKKEASEWKKHRNLLPDESIEGYSNPDGDVRGPWRSVPFSAQGFRPNQMYKITTPTGLQLDPPKGRCWGATESTFEKLKQDDRVHFPKDGNGRPRIKKFATENRGLVPMTWWPASSFSDNATAKREILVLFRDKEAFDTPKPEGLLWKILSIVTNQGDLVLDAFLGSGTTVAVAQKMNRRYIGIEIGDHIESHCRSRLQAVVNGEKGGISKDVGWNGGGGFRFYRHTSATEK